MSDLSQPSTSSSSQPRSRYKRHHPAEDDDDDDDERNNDNSNITAQDRPIGKPHHPICMRLQSSSRWATVGSSGEPSQHYSISFSGNGDGTSGRGPVRKRFRPGSHVNGGNLVSMLLANRVASTGTPANTKKLVPTIDWDALDGPPELFDQNGDRQSLVCSGGKRPKSNQLSPSTYLWNIGSIRKVENSEQNSFTNETSFELLKRLHRQLDEKDLKQYVPILGECQICSNEHCLLVIPQCPCRMPCCHSCMFSHLEASYDRRQEFLCPFCQQSPVRLYFNIKSDWDYRIWKVPRWNAPYTTFYPLIRAIGLLMFENSEVCGDGVNPLNLITYASFISAVTRTPERKDLLKLHPKQWFRAFVYIHDLIPWNYSAAQCTLPLTLCDEQAQHELNRLKDFLGAELCYFYSTLNLPEDFEKRNGTKMNRVLVKMRALVSKYASVQEYFERGEHFQNALTNLLPTDWILKDDIVNFNINVPKKIYTESLHFLNSRAPSLDTYIKRVIYTNLPFDQLIYDLCLSRRESRMLRNCLLEASSARLCAKLAANKERQRQRVTTERLERIRIAEIMNSFQRPQEEANEYEIEDFEDMYLDGLRGRFEGAVHNRFNLNTRAHYPTNPFQQSLYGSSGDGALIDLDLSGSVGPNFSTNRATTVSRAAIELAPIEEDIVSPDRTGPSMSAMLELSNSRHFEHLQINNQLPYLTPLTSYLRMMQNPENERTANPTSSNFFAQTLFNSVLENDDFNIFSIPYGDYRDVGSQENGILPISVFRDFNESVGIGEGVNANEELDSETESILHSILNDSSILPGDSTHSFDSSRDLLDISLSPIGFGEPLEHESQNVAGSESQGQSTNSIINHPMPQTNLPTSSSIVTSHGPYVASSSSLTTTIVEQPQPQPRPLSPAVASTSSAASSSALLSSLTNHSTGSTNAASPYPVPQFFAQICQTRRRRMPINQSTRNRPRPLSTARPPIRPRPFGSQRPSSRPSFHVSGSSSVKATENVPPFDFNTVCPVEKLRTACRDKGPGYKYFMRRIYPEESDGDSDSEDDDDEYITMRGKPSQWRRAKRSNLLPNGSSFSGSTNRQPDHIKSSSVSPGLWIESTSGINIRQQDDQGPSRDLASTLKVHLDSDSDSEY